MNLSYDVMYLYSFKIAYNIAQKEIKPSLSLDLDVSNISLLSLQYRVVLVTIYQTIYLELARLIV